MNQLNEDPEKEAPQDFFRLILDETRLKFGENKFAEKAIINEIAAMKIYSNEK